MISHPLIHEAGIFYDVPEAEYHAALALSATGIKWLRVSPLDWWARSPLNPEPHDEPPTIQMIIGTAQHKRILEGKEAFRQQYGALLERDSLDGDLPDTNEEIAAAIIAAGGPKPRSTMRKAELIEMLKSFSPEAIVWQDVVKIHREQNIGKTLLKQETINQIERAAAMIERHPDLSRAFTDGAPEVSIFWTDEQTGIPCKARLDYLKPQAIVDLKTVSNPYGMPFDKAVMRSIANYRYHIQAAFYLEAMKHFEPEVERTWLWVFQQQGIAPIARGYVLGPGTLLDIARLEIAEAKETWRRCWDTYQTDPWVDISDIREIDPLEIPSYVAE